MAESGILTLPFAILRQMIEHTRAESPRECCGLLSGRGLDVVAIHPLANEASDPEREFFVAEGLFEPYRRMREADHELLAIYHSHPASEAIPSKKDIERNYYGDLPHFIVSLAGPEPVVRGYRLGTDGFDAIQWRLLPEADNPLAGIS